MAAKKQDAGVYQLSNGKWGFRFKVRLNGKEIAQNRHKGKDGQPFDTKREAVKARKQAIAEAEKLAYTTGSKTPAQKSVTVQEVYDYYRRNGSTEKAYATLKKQDSIWNNHLCERFGERRIEEIEVGEINDYLIELYFNRGFAYRYVESFLKMFYLIYGQAFSHGMLDEETYHKLCVNRNTKIHMPQIKKDEDMDIIVFSDEECKLMDDYFAGTNAYTAYLLGKCCGLRINECYGLRWCDVDLAQGVIHIKQQMQYQ